MGALTLQSSPKERWVPQQRTIKMEFQPTFRCWLMLYLQGLDSAHGIYH